MSLDSTPLDLRFQRRKPQTAPSRTRRPPEKRAKVVALAREGLQCKEISEILNIAPETVWSHLRQARAAGDKAARIRRDTNRLSNRQLEVVRGIWENLSYEQIAARLNASEKTLKIHARQAAQKLGIPSGRMAVPLALWYERNHSEEIND